MRLKHPNEDEKAVTSTTSATLTLDPSLRRQLERGDDRRGSIMSFLAREARLEVSIGVFIRDRYVNVIVHGEDSTHVRQGQTSVRNHS
jgi:hypothetical protein